MKESTGDGQEVLNVRLLVCASVLSSGAQVWVALCRTQLDPGSSAADPPRDTAEHVGDAGGTSVEVSVRKGKMLHGREE